MAHTISASDKNTINFSTSYKRKAFHEGDHQLEKLQFALAISETRGDESKSALLRAQIADLGHTREEPGT